ncbi:MAG: lysophospholipid acyltransferase family protein [Acidobacteria bacterium]|nr:lysophospholipid acyltransferase family protein [Acidobacteriota bacterium]
MPDDVRVIRLGDMLFRRKGSVLWRLVQAVFSVALRLFFRRIEASHARLVPETGALIFVLNHPNGLIDPALVFCALPRRISFLAKSTLFRLPFVGFLLRTVEALPLYRRVDEGADLTQNRRTFEACRALLRRGRCIALFPEGVSHNAPHLLPVKTGAARIALGAISVKDAGGVPAPSFDVRIVPVGLYYTSKTSFRSEALMRFGRPLDVRPAELDADGEPSRAAVRELSARIEEALREVTLNVETEEQLEVANRAERLFSSIYEGINIERSLTARFLARLFTKHGVDEARATVKILAAIALMPLTWLVFTGFSFYFWGWRAGVLALPLSILCGYVAMRSLEALYDLRGWFKAVLLLFNRRQLFLRLLWERRALSNEISEMENRTGD